MFTQDTLKGHSILVTGGGSGLGLSMAKGFAQHGANVAICGRTAEKLEGAKKEIEEVAAPGVKVVTHAVDVRVYDAVGEMLEALVNEFGKLTGLVNNAAGNFLAASEDLTPGGFKAVVDIVLHGTFNCTQQFGKYLIDNGLKGNVLSITTTYVDSGSAFVLPSAAAKAGVQAMMNTLAYEWAEYGIRLNTLAPGPFPTKGAWSRLMPPGVEEMMTNFHPMKRVGEHYELMNYATFLMSDMAPYITGANATIDGAQRLQGGDFNAYTKMMPREQMREAFRAMKKSRD